MLCPRDKSVLQTHGEKAAFFCEICHGLWFGREQLAHFLRNENSAETLPGKKVFTAKIQRSATQCFCPSCGKTGLSAKVPDGVEIDFCKCCRGIWLDAGELDLIVARYRRKQKLERFKDGTAEFFSQAASDPGALIDLADLISDAFGHGSDWASEAASALLDFIGEAFSAIDF